MRRELSIYLDLLRVAAAMLVFLSHLSWAKLSGGVLWQLQRYGHDGVIVFFVLSGFVIQYVTTQKEHGLADYAIARFARLYSVVVPALLLTVLCDTLGQAIAPAIYEADNQTAPGLRIIASALFLTQSWDWNLATLSNTAYWSLPYEFWYYQIFGAALFLRGRQRIFWVALGCAAAGPAILIYLPIWLMGAAAYRAGGRLRLGEQGAWILFAASGMALAAVIVQQGFTPLPPETAAHLPPNFSALDYVLGALVALNLYAASWIALPVRQLGRPAAFLAGFSFALYLFHMPLLHLAATFVPDAWPVTLRGLALGSFTLLMVFALGWISERQKTRWAAAIALLFTRLGWKPGRG
ncbi:MAG TPA: acyltransferase [Rhodocyclaceae bacterium]|nr:acyltransferase [Rhodocyclaceae bacterium]